MFLDNVFLLQKHERSEVYCLNFVEVADVRWLCALVAMATAAAGTPLR